MKQKFQENANFILLYTADKLYIKLRVTYQHLDFKS